MSVNCFGFMYAAHCSVFECDAMRCKEIVLDDLRTDNRNRGYRMKLNYCCGCFISIWLVVTSN